MRINISLFAIAFICFFWGCYGTEVVRIKVMVDSKVDMKKYKTIAIMDLVDVKKNSNTEQGKALARMIRKQLRSSKEFEVISEGSMYFTLDEEIDKDKLEDREFLISVCEQLGADALVIGTFDFYQMAQPVTYVADRYSASTGNYSPETRTYIQKYNHLSFHAKVIDGKTGATIYDHSPSSVESPEYSSTLGSLFSGGSDTSSLRSVAARPIASLVLSLTPHYEYERRTLVR